MKKILFICGFPSGGTDLLKNMLNAHPDISLCGEMPFLITLYKYGYDKNTIFKNIEDIEKFRKIIKKLDVWNNVKNIGYDFTNLIEVQKSLTLEEILWHLVSTNGEIIKGNKTPQYTENIKNLQKLSNKFLFIIIVRDVRDICLSMRKKWGRNIYRTATNWNTRMKNGLNACKRMKENQCLLVRYEEIIDNQVYEIKKILKFLDVNWSERILEYYKYVDKIIDGKINYGKPIIKNNKEKWRMHFERIEVKKIEETAYDTMQLFKYPICYAANKKNINKYLLKYYEFLDFISMIFVGNRNSSKNRLSTRIKNFVIEIKKRFEYY